MNDHVCLSLIFIHQSCTTCWPPLNKSTNQRTFAWSHISYSYGEVIAMEEEKEEEIIAKDRANCSHSMKLVTIRMVNLWMTPSRHFSVYIHVSMKESCNKKRIRYTVSVNLEFLHSDQCVRIPFFLPSDLFRSLDMVFVGEENLSFLLLWTTVCQRMWLWCAVILVDICGETKCLKYSLIARNALSGVEMQISYQVEDLPLQQFVDGAPSVAWFQTPEIRDPNLNVEEIDIAIDIHRSTIPSWQLFLKHWKLRR